MSIVFRFDLNACTGCDACRLACTIENELGWGRSWRTVSTYNEPRHPAAPQFHISHACFHCADAPCETACPARAIARNEATGAVLIDAAKCIGCGYCGWVCPFDAPLFDEEAGVMTKCTFCDHRLAVGLAPACVALCPTGALGSRPAESAEGVAGVEGFPPQDVGPAVRFLPLREGARGPRGGMEERPSSASRIAPTMAGDLAHEWPLLVFTIVATILTAWSLAALGDGPDLRALPFLGAGAAAMAMGALHLGRPARAWRAILGWRTSWLSREILLFHVFLGATAAFFVGGRGAGPVAWIAVLAGLATLFCIDRIYDPVVRRPVVPLHSADTLPNALLLAAVLGGRFELAGPLLLVTAVLCVARRRAGEPRLLWWTARIGAGWLAPLVLLFAGPPGGSGLAVACLALGFVLDRIEFYRELTPSSPARQMAADLVARLTAARTPPADRAGAPAR